MSSRLFCLAVLLVSRALPAGVELVRFHDEDRSTLVLRDIEFPSVRRGFAVGSLVRGNGERSVAVVTSDAGQTWSEIPLPDVPVSTYCLDESACWLAARGGVWFSAETGRGWQRLSKEKLLTRVWFKTRERGWGVGARKKLVETSDGGRTWTKMAVSDEVKTSEDRTVFHALTFLNDSRGIIAGKVEPRSDELPIWMEAEPELEREVPSLSVVVESADGGQTWKTTSTSMFGRITTVRSSRRLPFAIALIEFDRYFTYPSELFRIDTKTGNSQRIFRDKEFAITDVVVLPDGTVVAAGFEPPGRLVRTPVPGKLRVMRTSDLSVWSTVDVDYRAVARRVSAGAAPDGTVWLATDTGMILRWRRNGR
jgi:hypothetical protein